MEKKEKLKHWICFVRKPEKDDIFIALISVVVLILGQLVFICIRDKCFFNPECQFIGWEKIWDIVTDEIWQDILLGLAITIIWYTIRNWIRFSKDKVFADQLKQSVDKVLSVVENNSESGKDSQERNRNMFYLTEIINNQINIGMFQPDHLLIEQVDKCNSILSITESPIALWLDPTYLFFLMVQAINNITKKVPTKDIVNTIPRKKEFLEKCKMASFFADSISLVERLSKMEIDDESDKIKKMETAIDKQDVRIYFMQVDDIINNKGLIEWFIAVHNYAGIHLLIIDKEILKEETFSPYITEIRKKMDIADEDFLDVAFRFYDDSLWYARRNFNQLHDATLVNADPFVKTLVEFLKEVASAAINAGNKLLYPNKCGNFNEKSNPDLQKIILNEDKTQLIIN